jgi:hypothetical protein
VSALTIRREFEFPSFGAGKWTKADHDRPLRLQLTVARALIYLEEDKYTKRNIIVFPQGRIELIYDPAPDELIAGLQSKGAKASATAQIIYEGYVEAHNKFVALLYSPGQLRYVYHAGPDTISSFFGTLHSIRGKGVEWKVNDGPFQRFTPPLPKPKGRNPMFKADQLVTPSRWLTLQRAADAGDYVDGEMLELYRIRGKAAWRELRVAAIEASIISESLLRTYGVEILKRNGFSNSKIKRLRDEMTFNNLLNILLPLSLSGTELRKIQSHIDAVDTLRGIRNDLVHGNINEKDLDSKQVSNGIDSAIKLVKFLRVKV